MSFKLKLVAYFLLVSLLPLGAAGWALHSVDEPERDAQGRRSPRGRAPRGSRDLQDELSAADDRASALAVNRDFQQALQRRRPPAELRRLVRPVRGVRLETTSV